MIIQFFKKLFGINTEIPANEQFYSPLRIGLHTTININTVDWLIIRDTINSKMVLPTSSMSVLAIGKTIVDRDTIFQIYLMDDVSNAEEFILQLFCVGYGDSMRVEEATLYKEVANVIPLTEDGWTEYLNSIGNSIFRFNSIDYSRVWASDHDGKVELVTFTENVIMSDGEMKYTNNYMLYKRELSSMTGEITPEMLLVGVEETDDTAEITIMLGLGVPLSNIDIQ